MIFIGGSIIPWTENANKCSYFVRSEPVILKIFVDENKNAKGQFYLDDGISIDIKGEYIYMEYELKDKRINIKNNNNIDDFEKKKLNEITPVYNKVEIYGYGKINSAKSESKEFNVNYDSENDCNTIDLSSYLIKINKSFEIELIQ